MRTQSRRSLLVASIALAASVALAGTAATGRPRTQPRPAPLHPTGQFADDAIDGNSMVRAPQTQHHPGFIGGADDGQSIRRAQPRHHGGNHHRAR